MLADSNGTPSTRPQGIAKAPTGIAGLDELTRGGLPAGRPTLVCGGPGCGKTLLSATFLVNGATRYGESGVFVSFEERIPDLVKNVASLGFDLDDLMARGLLAVDQVRVEPAEIEETGQYDLEALFVRLGFAIDSVGARRIVLDTIETLFGGLGDQAIVRAELRRLFEWLKERGVSTIVTGERGDGVLTRYGLEEYVSDCVIVLDHRVDNQTSTRRLRVVKYRGSAHGTNEYPFLIDDDGITVMPVTSAGLDHDAAQERIGSGIAQLDEMMGGQGWYRGSSILVSGMAGAGKSSVAAHFVDAACARGERAIYFAFEESSAQIVRNMRSIGLDLQRWIDAGLLTFRAQRPTLQGLEMHLSTIYRDIERLRPLAVVLDPITSFGENSLTPEVHGLLLRLLDHFKARGVTSLMTSLTHAGIGTARTDVHISSLMDTWLLLLNEERDGERNRRLYFLKSRGIPHSNQIREFLLTDQGIELRPVYVGADGVLLGRARMAQEAKDQAALLLQRQDVERRRRELERRRARSEARIQAIMAEIEGQEDELGRLVEEAEMREGQLFRDRDAEARSQNVLGRRSPAGSS